MKSMDEMYGGDFPVVRLAKTAPLSEVIIPVHIKAMPSEMKADDEVEGNPAEENAEESEEEEYVPEDETGLSLIDPDSLKNVTPKRFLWSRR